MRNDDGYQAIEGDGPQSLNVLANDPFWDGYDGERRITSVVESSLGSEVTIAADGKSLVYTAPEEITGRVRGDYVRYVVDGSSRRPPRWRVYSPVQDDSVEVDTGSAAFPIHVLQTTRSRA